MSFWINGHFRTDTSRVIGLADRGFLLGDGLFETLLVRGGQPVFLSEHLARLQASADMIGLPVPYDGQSILKAIRSLVGKQEKRDGDFSVRITLSRGQGPRGVAPPAADKADPVMVITIAPAPPARRGAMGCMLSSVRRNEGSPAARMKALSYIDNILARQEAAGAGADEAIMLNNQGLVACASAANLFLLAEGDRLLTPSVDCGILPGIVRAKIMECATGLGLSVEEGFVQDQDIETMPFFLTNSLIGLVPAYLEDGAPPPAAARLSRLAKAYGALVDRDVARLQER